MDLHASEREFASSGALQLDSDLLSRLLLRVNNYAFFLARFKILWQTGNRSFRRAGA